MAKFTVQVTIQREAETDKDPKGNWGPRGYEVELTGLIDQELELPLPPGATDAVLAIPSVGSDTQLVFIRCDVPSITYKRNLETVVNPLGATGMRLEAGAPENSTPLTQLLFSNPGSIAATVYVLVAGA